MRLPCGVGRLGLPIALLVCLLAGGCDKSSELVLVNTEKEANHILVELVDHGIASAAKESRTEQRRTLWAINVSKSDLDKARRILTDLDLPRDDLGGFDAMLSQSGLIPTRSDERAKLMHAMSAELERTFEVCDRIVRARVHLVLPDTDVLERDSTTKPTPSAMVFIKYSSARSKSGEGFRSAATTRPDTRPVADDDPPITREVVREMVARSVQGLKPEDVVVAYQQVAFGREDSLDSRTLIQSFQQERNKWVSQRMQLLAAVLAFGMVSIVLILSLVREKRKVAAPKR
ncbi:MAG: hypothetical protein ABSH20_13915 [Tepidisphaeraceae bacterium]